MKKAVLLFISLIFFTTNALADEVENPVLEKKEVKLVNCEGATTSWYEVDDNIKRIRLLAYDPDNGDLNLEIDEYACNKLKNAKKIEIEYDQKALEKDKYNRELAFIYVDGSLLQEELIKKGYGQVNFITAEYQHLTTLCEAEKSAILSKSGIWNYAGIKESYCKSGININNTEEEIKEETLTEKEYNMRDLYYLLFIDSGIVLLVLLLVKRG